MEATDQNSLVLKDEMSLREILDLMDSVDGGDTTLSMAQLQELGEKAVVKVDSYKFFLDKCAACSQELRNKAARFIDAATQVNALVQRVEDLMLFHMKSKGIEKLPGNDWRVALVTRKNDKLICLDEQEPGPMEAARWFDLVNVKYSWRRADIKRNIKAGTAGDELMQRFRLEDSYHLRWSVNKKGVDE